MAGQRLIEQGVERREAIMAFLTQYLAAHQLSPTVEEIAVGVDAAKTTVRAHLARLEAEKRVQFTPGKCRSVRLVK